MTGVEYVRVRGVQGLSEAGVLKGVRAMVARIYGGEEWYISEGRNRVECLYARDNGAAQTVQFIVAVMTGDDEWARRRAGRGDEGREGREGEEGGAEREAGRGAPHFEEHAGLSTSIA